MDPAQTIEKHYDDWFESKKTQICFFFPNKTEMELKIIFRNVFTEGALAGTTLILEKMRAGRAEQGSNPQDKPE